MGIEFFGDLKRDAGDFRVRGRTGYMGQGTGGALAEFRTGVEGQFDIWVSMQEILDAATRSA